MSKEDNSDELDAQEQQRIEADTDDLPSSSKSSFRSIAIRVNAAPTPSTRAKLAAPTSTSLQTYDPLGSQQRQLVKQGPSCQDPNGPAETSKGKVGQVEQNVTFDDVAFDTNRKLFQKSGIALAPDDRGSVIAKDRGHYRPVVNLFSLDGGQAKRQRLEQLNAQQPLLVEGSDDEAIYGIWGPPTAHERHQELEAITDVAAGKPLLPEQLAERAFLEEKARRKGLLSEETTTAQQQDRLVERKMSHLLPPRLEGEEATPIEPSTKFHGAADFDYKGLPWTAPPAGVRPILFGDVDHHRCYVPKKCVHRFTGHTKGVQRIRLFPGTGHLLLSAGIEGKCKVWSIEQKQCMRTYIGHSAAVRDVQFNNDGTKFLSASFDRFLRLWDTESGQVLQTFTNRRVPYVVQFYPKDNNFFVVGCSDNKIVTYDATTAEITQEYNHHLAPVNTITFCEDATKMVTSSDDKKILIWEWDIGVPIKYISDPTMHSIPVITKHPSDLYFVGQSLDNQIVVYQAQDRFALQRKKRFVGHQIAGYACDIAISPDGKFVLSGDGDGKIYFWDWRSHKLLQKYRAHDNGPAIGCVWHPIEPSVVFSCGWDGVIKMWSNT
mmetsp:Transcript_20725/g.29542  ORF Transcript_20725/g.29542 Transcript_20725/m.29542 type:complete len:604 (-) Transcript_20725:39-1850(-)